MTRLTHFNSSGDAHMVDVGDKPATRRVAVARGLIRMLPETLSLIAQGSHKKGDVIGVARIAGIMAVKKTADLIPLCHSLAVDHAEICFEVSDADQCVYCEATVETSGKTGVEMEALTAVQVALLTIYDMCKAVDRGMSMEGICLVKKSGGKSGDWQRES